MKHNTKHKIACIPTSKERRISGNERERSHSINGSEGHPTRVQATAARKRATHSSWRTCVTASGDFTIDGILNRDGTLLMMSRGVDGSTSFRPNFPTNTTQTGCDLATQLLHPSNPSFHLATRPILLKISGERAIASKRCVPSLVCRQSVEKSDVVIHRIGRN